jgi:branched-chain amino acid transport system permease protein
MPMGLAPTLAAALQRSAAAKSIPEPGLDARPQLLERLYPKSGGAELVVEDLSKRFGQVAAVNGLSLRFAQTGVNCVLGPNGAGKSSFFGLLAGRFSPTSGRILLRGVEITQMESYRRARNGLGIKLQVPSVYPGLTVRENLWLAAFAGAREVGEADQRTVDMADWMGLQRCFGALAGTLAHGQQQWLEIGMVLLTSPSVILLDEPTAGMTREETSRTAVLTRELGEKASVVVVEHDMDFVRQLGVTSTVFHQGRVFAHGRLEELRKNEKVLDIYLGRRRQHAEA